MIERVKKFVSGILGNSIGEEPGTARLRAVTAAQIPHADSSQITILGVWRGNETVSWRASFRGKTYKGYADGLLLNVSITLLD